MIKIDAIGQTCPMPVIMTKKALKNIIEGEIEVSIDNIISKENIEKFAKEMEFACTSILEDGVYKITIIKTSDAPKKSLAHSDNTVIVVEADAMGQGDLELGRTLIKGFFYTLTEMESLPKTIIFYNRGVFLVSEIQDSIEDLKVLEERGVEILSCGACVNFYNLQNSVKVGKITNMLNIIETQMKATRIIKP